MEGFLRGPTWCRMGDDMDGADGGMDEVSGVAKDGMCGGIGSSGHAISGLPRALTATGGRYRPHRHRNLDDVSLRLRSQRQWQRHY